METAEENKLVNWTVDHLVSIAKKHCPEDRFPTILWENERPIRDLEKEGQLKLCRAVEGFSSLYFQVSVHNIKTLNRIEVRIQLIHEHDYGSDDRMEVKIIDFHICFDSEGYLFSGLRFADKFLYSDIGEMDISKKREPGKIFDIFLITLTDIQYLVKALER